ncbi:MAG: hypothetical protein JSR77_12245 [Planctomycetes bacterium]|nr:hypothetical protein [Planctomycetota bacterium]
MNLQHSIATLLRPVWIAAAVVAAFLAASARAQDTAPVPAARKAKNVAVIPVRGKIDHEGVMAASVSRRIDTAVRAGADAIVFEIDTPGGDIGGLLAICGAVRQAPIRNTVAWLNPTGPNLPPAGAVIAMACQEIVVADGATLAESLTGLNDPLAMPPGPRGNRGLKAILPPLLTQVVGSARERNTSLGGYFRDEYLAQALIAGDVELWYIRNPATGVKMCIDRREFAMLFPGVSPDARPRLAGAPGTGGAPSQPLAPPQPAPAGGVSVPAGSAMIAAAAPDVSLATPTLRPTLTPADAGKWELIDKVTDGTAPAVLSAADMLHYGLTSNDTQMVNSVAVLKPVRNEQDLAAFFGANHVRRFERTWSEGLVLFLTNFFVRGVLIVIFLIALAIEITHPGVMLPGAVALGALVALLAPPALIGLASWWEIAAILLGLLLIGLEVFVIPGFGVTGIAGLLLLFLGLIGTFVPNGDSAFPDSPEGRRDMLWGAVTLILSFGTAGVGVWLVAKHFGSIPLLGKLVLKSPGSDDDNGFLEAMDPDASGSLVKPGQVGVALTPMRPAGRIQVGDHVLDACAELGFIQSGHKVRVVSVTPMRIGVEAVRDA